ncbi:MAG: response regulator [Odoribacter sp.]
MEDNSDRLQKTILVAEDVESNFLLLKALLGKTYTMLHALNGQEAIDLFQSEKPDLILMDVKMPFMDGLEATRQIRQLSLTIPIIALTAFAFDQDRIRTLAAGCNDFLTKPLVPKILKEMIEKYI